MEQAHLLRVHSRRQLQFHLEQRVGDFRVHVQQHVQLREQFHACSGLAVQPLVHGGVQCPEGTQILAPELEDGIGQLRVKTAKTADLAYGFHIGIAHLEVQVAGQHVYGFRAELRQHLLHLDALCLHGRFLLRKPGAVGLGPRGGDDFRQGLQLGKHGVRLWIAADGEETDMLFQVGEPGDCGSLVLA